MIGGIGERSKKNLERSIAGSVRRRQVDWAACAKGDLVIRSLPLRLAGAAVVVVVLALAAAPFLIPVDRYRPLVTWAVARATGREIAIDKLQLYLVPAIRIRAVNFH